MAVLSLDIGTTKICALVMDAENGTVIETRSMNNAFLPPSHPWERQQDPDWIFGIVEDLVSGLIKKYGKFQCMGISNQMHGILYVNDSGRALSPLYTWQEQCASLPYAPLNGAPQNGGGESYAAFLAKYSPSPVAPGYGLTSCFYHLCTNGIPSGVVKLCTIGDYIAMRLCNITQPVMHSTNAASLGFFDLKSFCFDENAMEKAGLKVSLLPRVIRGAEVFGETSGGIPVCVAIGDNQSSFLGAVRDPDLSISVSIGTGGIINLASSEALRVGNLETWPYFDGLYLLVGATLCGGRAYAILESFFRKVLKIAGKDDSATLYQVMNDLALETLDAGTEAGKEGALTVNTLFSGTRIDPSLRGSILNISEDNFTPAQLVTGFLYGVVNELYDLYLPAREKGKACHSTLVGSGNAIRKNEALKRILSEKFNMSLTLPSYPEEAAYGAALFALTSTGFFKNVSEAQRFGRKS